MLHDAGCFFTDTNGTNYKLGKSSMNGGMAGDEGGEAKETRAGLPEYRICSRCWEPLRRCVTAQLENTFKRRG